MAPAAGHGQLTARVDGGAAQTEEELLDHHLSRLVGALYAGHHTVSISETDNRRVTSVAAPFSLDVTRASATLLASAPTVVAAGGHLSVTAQLTLVAPTRSAPVTFALEPAGSPSYQSIGARTADQLGRPVLDVPAKRSGTWRATSAASLDREVAVGATQVRADVAAPTVTSATAGWADRPTLGPAAVTFAYGGRAGRWPGELRGACP